MPRSIRPVTVNHMNVVLADFDASVAHLQDVYGAEWFADMPQKEFHACLIHMGRAIFEYFVPYDFLVCARYGPHFLGLEYQANIDEVRAAVADHGIGIVRDIGLALHTDPADCFGVSYEFYDGYFHDRDWDMIGGQIKPAEYWRDEQPLGLTGLVGHTHAVHDIAAASAFLQSFLGAEPVYEARRPAIAAHAIGLKVADAVIELVTPDGAGPLAQHLRRHGEGIRSAVFGVRDLEQARRHLAGRGIALVPGTAEGSFAVPAEANRGLIFEFSEMHG
jgi:hypothetical protein